MDKKWTGNGLRVDKKIDKKWTKSGQKGAETTKVDKMYTKMDKRRTKRGQN